MDPKPQTFQIHRHAPLRKLHKKNSQFDAPTPELELLFAILERAVLDCSCQVLDRKEQLAAISWLLDDTFRPFSFSWIIERLGITDRVANKVRRLVAC